MHTFNSVSTHYECLREDVVPIAYAPLEASAVVIREVYGCTPIRV